MASQLRQPRLAELIADELRSRILSGELPDGGNLPKQEDLLDEFKVSVPSLREATRILETEGLVTVRRGNLGGGTVHAPRPESAAYMLGLVLESRKAPVHDLAQSLRHIEPVCAGLCANRDDRASMVVPQLHEILEASLAALEDGVRFTELSRRFHEEIVTRCGSQTLAIVVGAIESLWSFQEREWAATAEATGGYPSVDLRREVLTAHEKLVDTIAAGDVAGAQTLARGHLARSQLYALTEDQADRPVRAVRSSP